MIVDFHIHLAPGVEGEAAEPRTRYTHGVPVATEHALLGDVASLLSAIDDAGIEVAVLSSGRGLRGTMEGARVANEGLARLVEQHPERLRFVAHVPSPAEGGWLGEADRWLDRCPGAGIPAGFGPVQLDDEALDPLYALLERRGRYLWIHPPLIPTAEEAGTFGRYDLYRTVGREFALMVGLLRLVLGGVLDRHPDLTVIVSHLGGGISALLPRVRSYQEKAFWGVEEDPLHGRSSAQPFESYLSRIYFDTGGFFGDGTAVDIALEHIPPDRILLGTDYPQELRSVTGMRTMVDALRERGLAGQGADLLWL